MRRGKVVLLEEFCAVGAGDVGEGFGGEGRVVHVGELVGSVI